VCACELKVLNPMLPHAEVSVQCCMLLAGGHDANAALRTGACQRQHHRLSQRYDSSAWAGCATWPGGPYINRGRACDYFSEECTYQTMPWWVL
jgi:hypothetical protein